MPKRWVNAGERIPCSSKEPKPKFSECIRVRAIVAWICSQSSKHLAKQRRYFANIVPKPSPNSGYTRTGGNTFPSKKKSCQKSRKMNFCHQNSTQSCHYFRNPKLHSIASSIRNERNLLPYWSGSAVLKISKLRKEDLLNYARSELMVKLELFRANKLIP